MRFWDSSTLVSLLGPERDTEKRERLLRGDAEMVAWWGTHTECVAALTRKTRELAASSDDLALGLKRLAALAAHWIEVAPSMEVRRTAERLLRVHVLRAADALQLAAALIACGHEPDRLSFVCSDRRLAEAARREGFLVIE
jgi:hypothetical protein